MNEIWDKAREKVSRYGKASIISQMSVVTICERIKSFICRNLVSWRVKKGYIERQIVKKKSLFVARSCRKEEEIGFAF